MEPSTENKLPTRDPATGQFVGRGEARDPEYDDLRESVYNRLLEEFSYEKGSFSFRLLATEISRTQAGVWELDAALDRVGAVDRRGRQRTIAVAREKMAARLTRLMKQLPAKARYRR